MKYIIIIVLCLLLIPGVVCAAWQVGKPDKNDTASKVVDDIYDNMVFLKAVGDRIYAYEYPPGTYGKGWNNAHPGVTYILGPVLSGDVTSLVIPGRDFVTGDIVYDTTHKIPFIYRTLGIGTRWDAIGSLQYRGENPPVTCSAETFGMTYFKTNAVPPTTYECTYKDATYQWVRISEAAQTIAGVSAISDGTNQLDGLVRIIGGTKINFYKSSWQGTDFFQIDYIPSSYSQFRRIDIQAAEPGNTYAPTTSYIGGDKAGARVMWFSGSDTRQDQIDFYFSLHEKTDLTHNIQIIFTAIIRNTKSGGESVYMCFDINGKDVPPFDDSCQTISLNDYEPYTSGDPFTKTQYITWTIPENTFTPEQGVRSIKVSLWRDPSNVNDNWDYDFGLVHGYVALWEKNTW